MKNTIFITFLIILLTLKSIFLIVSSPLISEQYYDWIYTEKSLERVTGGYGLWESLISGLVDFYNYGF
ncbi:hypothetical protein [Natranaerobius trueperi]|uniref:Uncharacterized protein n=1 Tax=Natranaerobius trueperi TaxID=759412 RepID=A0A226C0L1_9FIRM|nr:hypothetical protein [Natranaerobius trueperi]OWZ83989.1 hypothetical protein CDO51_05365 [Natranaerobius trueperi]